MKSYTFFILLLALPFITCLSNPTKVAEKTVKIERTVSFFNGIAIANCIELIVKPGNSLKITIEAPADLIDYVKTDVKNNILNIYQRNKWMDFSNNTIVTVTIQCSAIQSVEMSGACRGNIEPPIRENLKINFSGASRMIATIQNQKTKIELSGASLLEVSGRSDACNIDISGASKLNAEDLIVRDYDAELTGASKASIQVTNSLNCNLSGASKLTYRGRPSTVRKTISGASSIIGK